MPQPAGELLEEVCSLQGEKRFIAGVDRRGRIDLFIYSKERDTVYQVKLESIRPALRGDSYGYHLVGVGDEICAGDELIERIMEKGWELNDPEKMLEKVNKIQAQGWLAIPIRSYLGSDGLYGVFSSIPPGPFYDELLQKLPRSIDGKLSSGLDRYLDRNRLGTSTYIA